uniref:Major facilitator superfamily (MFS) profile domain-containing protein n=1 Tax=Acrobeloides nanus TaxID=290746 RepID=A0A914CG58_9BILA
MSYALYHATRKNLSGVKASILNDWMDNENTTSHRHEKIFDSEKDAKTFLGTLDGIFMILYAVSMFFWGWLGDRTNPRNVVILGMIGSGLTLFLFGTLPYWLLFYSTAYYVFIYILFGIFQGCGWPNEVTIMANWFPKTNRGFIMGLWAACQPLGNIIGAILVSIVLPLGYQYTFAFNSLLIILGAIALFMFIESKPSSAGYNYEELSHDESETPEVLPTTRRRLSSASQPITMLEAILLPNVLAYCLCNACLKLVNYAFFFWLPYYLTSKYGWAESESNQLATWYDIGGIVGSVIGGIISDRLGYRSPVIVVMLIASLGTLSVYNGIGASKVLHVLFMTILGITVSGPYNLIVGTISVDLGSQPALAGNSKAMSTVSGLIDGTGSAGSAIGQFLVPFIQTSFDWQYVFYMFIIMNGLSILCLAKRFYQDCCLLISPTFPSLVPRNIEERERLLHHE